MVSKTRANFASCRPKYDTPPPICQAQGYYLLDKIDRKCNGIVLILVATFELLLMAYAYGTDRFFSDLNMMVSNIPTWFTTTMTIMWKFITPALYLIFLFINMFQPCWPYNGIPIEDKKYPCRCVKENEIEQRIKMGGSNCTTTSSSSSDDFKGEWLVSLLVVGSCVASVIVGAVVAIRKLMSEHNNNLQTAIQKSFQPLPTFGPMLKESIQSNIHLRDDGRTFSERLRLPFNRESPASYSSVPVSDQEMGVMVRLEGIQSVL